MHTVSFRRGRIAMTVCDCCGPNAAQARLARGAATTATSGPVDELMVVCMNSRCRRTQLFACAMDFCGRAYHDIPKHLHKSDPWLKEMMPYYRRHCRTRAQPEGNINIPNCIRCCLSATIPMVSNHHPCFSCHTLIRFLGMTNTMTSMANATHSGNNYPPQMTTLMNMSYPI